MTEINDNKIWIASFDPASLNFAFCIEEIDVSRFESIKNIPFNERYNFDGTCKPQFQNILNDVCSNGKIILCNNVNLKKDSPITSKHHHSSFQSMIDCLDEYKSYWDQVHYFIIERQLKKNVIASRLSVVCISYFLFQYGNFREIVEFESKHKTMVLGAPRDEKKYKNGKTKFVSTSGYTRKKWSVQTGTKLLNERNESETLTDIAKIKKKDDVFDTILQLQAFKFLRFVDQTI
jgi:hypothetical protein